MFYTGVDDQDDQRLGYVSAAVLDTTNTVWDSPRNMIWEAANTNWAVPDPPVYSGQTQFRDCYLMSDPEHAGCLLMYYDAHDSLDEKHNQGGLVVGVARSDSGSVDAWHDLGYFPNTLKVPVNTTVTFVNKSPQEPHTVTFGPKKWIQQFSQKTDLFPTGPGKPNQAAPVIPYGSEPKGQYNYDGKTHGNGFFSTPVTSASKAVPAPQSWKVTFTKPGTFKYICWIHGPDMSGTIVVTP